MKLAKFFSVAIILGVLAGVIDKMFNVKFAENVKPLAQVVHFFTWMICGVVLYRCAVHKKQT